MKRETKLTAVATAQEARAFHTRRAIPAEIRGMTT
jgi:hypothetical protein